MVTRNRYVPERGDIVWLNFSPTRGHEQGGERPALVLSRSIYNAKTSLVVIVAITSKSKGYEFEVPIIQSLHVRGVILSDQVRTLDWRSRRARYIETIDIDIVDEVEGKIH